jgi:energy-coupling factor transporter ATP-binding protein EcfA2
MRFTTPTQSACAIIVPRGHEKDEVALASAMHGLVLDAKHPLALEIAGTPASKQFLLRATTAEAMQHATSQIRARYPQATITPLSGADDPFHLEPGEAVSGIELRGTAPDLPLRTLEDRELVQPGKDPVLGLLAALENLPPDTRAIAQLALAPAKANWSRAYTRRGIEHALEPERQQKMANLRSGGGPSTSMVILAVAGVLIMLLFQVLHVQVGWILGDLLDLLHGDVRAIPSDQFHALIISGGILLLGGASLFILIDQLRYRFKKPPYDQRLVAQKIQGAAYHVRLRVYVIGPGTPPGLPQIGLGGMRQLRTSLRQLGAAIGQAQHTRRWQQLGAAPSQPLLLPLLRSALSLALLSLRFLGDTLWHRGSGTWNAFLWRRSQAQQRRIVLAQFTAAYRQYHLAQGDYFQPASLSGRKVRRCLHGGWGRDVAWSTHLLSAEALASLWHLPTTDILADLALVESRSVRTQLIPPPLARLGGPVMGVSEHAGYAVPVPLIPDLLRLHGLVCGKSGEGKSTLLEHLAQTAMEQGEGLLLADPHGDLADEVLRLVPAYRVDDVVLIDLSDTEHALGLNPIDVLLGREREKAISDILNTFSYLFATGWGHRMANAFRAGLRTLYEANRALVARDPQNGPAQQYTLLDILPLFTSESFCHALLQDVQDAWLRRWWRKYYEPLNLYMQRDIINPVLNKTTEFEGPIPSHIIGQGRSSIDFKQLIYDQRILIVKLAQGTVGHDIAALVGTTLLGLLHTTLEEQGQRSKEQRRRMLIMIDEFQTLTGLDFQALAQLRKYGATFVLATQSLDYLDELDRKILPVIFANVQHLTSFQVSAEDAKRLTKELGVEEEALTNLPTHVCYGRWTSREERQQPFSFRLTVPELGPAEQAEVIRLRSTQRYTLPISLVETRLAAAIERAESWQTKSPPAQTGWEDTTEAPPAPTAPTGAEARQQKTLRQRKDRGRKAEQARKKAGSQPSERTPHQGSIIPMELVASRASQREDNQEPL